MTIKKLEIFVFSLAFFSSAIYASDQANEFGISRLNEPVYKKTSGRGLPGEFVDVRTGQLYWEVTDLRIPGNGGLDIEVTRSFAKGTRYPLTSMGNWALEVPRIMFNVNPAGYSTGGHPGHGGKPAGAGACVNPESSGYLGVGGGLLVEWPGAFYFNGIQLLIPGESPKALVFVDESATKWPEGTQYVSEDGWVVKCVATANTNGRKDAFLVTSPNGTKYTMDKLANQHGHIGYNGLGPTGSYPGLTRVFATNVLDRHGNSLNYSYTKWNGARPEDDFATQDMYYLSGITASDGRSVQIGKSGSRSLIDTITANGKTWSYSYSNRQLTSVTDPEGNAWSYNYGGPKIGAFFKDTNKVYPELELNHLSRVNTPLGAQIDYSYSSRQSKHFGGTESLAEFFSISSRVLSGPALDTSRWDYAYTQKTHSDGTPINVTTVTGPKDIGVYNFHKPNWLTSPFYGLTHSVAIKDKATSVQLREEEFDYVYLTERLGNNKGYKTGPSSEYKILLTDHTVDNQYTLKNYLFDIYGYPVLSEEIGTVTRARYTPLEHNTNLWVLGQPKYEMILDDGVVAGGAIVGDLNNNEGVISYLYDSRADLIEKTEFGFTKKYSYNSQGNLHKESIERDGQVFETVYSDYYRGTARLENLPEGVSKIRTVNSDGTIASESDGNGNVTSYTYDGISRLQTISPPIGEIATLSWPTSRQRVVNRGNYQETIEYDALGNAVSTLKQDVSSGSKIHQNFDYDIYGNQTFKSYESESSSETKGIRTNYDALDRPIRTTNTSDNSQLSICYSALCNDSRVDHGRIVIDERGYETLFHHRIFSDPTAPDVIRISQQALKSSENSGVDKFVDTVMERDLSGKLLKVTQGNFFREYIYDGRNRLWQEKNPESGTTYYTYDDNGNLIYRRIGEHGVGSVEQYSYDGLNRLFEKAYDVTGLTPEPLSGLRYRYDDNGSVTSIESGNTLWEYTYDELNTLTSEVVTIDDAKLTLSYTYDALGAMSSMTYPSGLSIDYAPNALGRSTKVGSFVSGIQNFPSGEFKSMTLANGQLSSQAKNSRNLVASLTSEKAGSSLMSVGYTYDVTGNVTNINESLNSALVNNRSMSYDGLNRLVSAVGTLGSSQYNYSNDGNLQSKTVDGVVSNFAYDAINNRLTGVAGGIDKAFSYDLVGNVESNGIHTFDYNDASRLISVNSNVNYEYDGNDNRIVIDDGNTKTYTIHNKTGQLIYTLVSDGSKSSDHVYHQGRMVARVDEMCSGVAEDTDTDQMPDCWEKSVGLDPLSPSDANLDPDGDGLTNLEEFSNGASITRSDTDNDGMPDLFEVANGLDPSVDDSNSDRDSDGLSNLAEYNASTDVNNPDTDGDGMLDGYEWFHSLNPLFDDGLTDGDRDGFTNFQEFQANTNPNDGSSFPGTAGTRQWYFETEGEVWSSPAIASDGTVYTGSNDGFVYAVGSDGLEKWRYQTGAEVRASPAIDAQGNVIVGSMGNGKLWSISPQGVLNWVYQSSGQIYSSAAIGNEGTIYFGASDGRLYSLTSSGVLNWRASVGAAIISSPAIGDDGTIYFGADNNVYYALNPNVTVKWSLQAGGRAQGSPAIDGDGSVYFGYEDGNLVSVDSEGSIQWVKKLPGMIVSQPTVAANGTVYVGTDDDRLYAFDGSGNVKWIYETGGNVISTPTIGADGKVYFGSLDGKLRAVDANGASQWIYNTGGGVWSSPVLSANGQVYFGSLNGRVYSLFQDSGAAENSIWPMFRKDVEHRAQH